VREESGVRLADRTTLRLGGPARRVVTASTYDEVVEVVRDADASGEPLLVLGGGSNLVVADEGFEGTALRLDLREYAEAPPATAPLSFGAGVEWDEAVRFAVDLGYAGIEALSGIPGLVGAAPIQNVGAYGQEVAQTIVSVRALDRTTHQVVELAGDECGFTYRDSTFKRTGRYVVLHVSFAVEKSPLGAPVRYAELARALGVELGDRAPLADVRAAVLALRARKGMVLDPADHDTWSAGSFFTNPVLDTADAERLPAEAPRWPERDGRVKTSAAWLIEQAGFTKGYGAETGSGRVRLSTKHTLALTNRGGATTADLLTLARELRDGVEARFGIRLVPEPVLLGCTL
jgi:UDP-N-acetylmuramate dehydrogenase